MIYYYVTVTIIIKVIVCNANKSAAAIISVFIKLEDEKATFVDLTKQIENIMYIFYCCTVGRVDTK